MAAVKVSSRYEEREAESVLPAVRKPLRLGAHLVAGGADFVVLAPHASAVILCLFDDGPDGLVERRYSMRSEEGFWLGHVRGVRAGQRYGYRVEGRWAPDLGMHHNPAKLLLDPYARAITKSPDLVAELYPHRVNEDLSPTAFPPKIDHHDSAPFMSLGVVTEPNDVVVDHPYIPWEKTIIYEAHVKGLTKLSPGLPEELRGTYAGLGHEYTTARLKKLGVTAVELLPIHAKMDEPFLAQKGLTNYWGYNTLAFFAPEPSYATQAARDAGPQAVVAEVKEMVRKMHDAGLEVILDVVYNHTCEGGVEGPSVSWRGLDQTSYYMQDPNNPARFMDTTGCGNSLDFRRQKVVRLALDSLRYWVSEIGVDGFRFDLAVTLGRNGDQFDSHHPFYVAMTTDPILGGVKIINEPWDLGPNGWQTGRFISPSADWNDHFRDTVRSFWVAQPRSLVGGGHGGDLRDLATRLAGSADLFGHGRIPGGRGPQASINFVTAHDGFTMADLVSFNSKHNDANLESNRDGTNDNKSWDHGFDELQSDEEAPRQIAERRRRSIRNLLGTLLLSAGTPMLTAGDEIARTQHGNNNSYCQDNEISWVDWRLEQWHHDLEETVSYLLRVRREHSVLRPKHFYTEGLTLADQVHDLEWFDNEGQHMPDHKWFDSHFRILQMLRSGAGDDVDALLVLNGSITAENVRLPEGRGDAYELVWDSAWEKPRTSLPVYRPGAMANLEPLSIRLYLTKPRIV
ncbi:glycogen debranching protein GlgX [Actinomycetaceae bacterium L2_0104]